MECKQMYSSGLRVYLLDNYNWMDFALLSLYLASYILRFLVDHWIKETDNELKATNRAREALLIKNYTQYESIMQEVHDSPRNYFMMACEYSTNNSN